MKKYNLTLELFYLFLVSFILHKSIIAQEGWQLISSFSEIVTSIYFLDTNTGFASTATSIIKTTDVGYNWNLVTNTSSSINRIYFYNNNLGFAIGSDGVLYRTINGGNNWNLIPT